MVGLLLAAMNHFPFLAVVCILAELQFVVEDYGELHQGLCVCVESPGTKECLAEEQMSCQRSRKQNVCVLKQTKVHAD